jgi:hemerythrin-like domain-containing protein
MSRSTPEEIDGPAQLIEPIDPNLFCRPIEYLQAEHYRQRIVMQHLEFLTRWDRGPTWQAVARGALRYLTEDLALHIADEEQDLFPLLRRRARPDDGIKSIMAVLTAEHGGDEAMASAVIRELELLVATPRATPSGRFHGAVRAFVETQRRHLSWENAVVLPLAAKRLSRADQRRLGEAMAKRRRVAVPRRRAASRVADAVSALRH